jgi:hypothetical protein
MSDVVLGSPIGGTFTLSHPQRGEDGELWWVTAGIEVEGLRAATQVEPHYASGFDDLVALLDELADNWRGWDGVKSYDSLEHDLALSARHDGVGHVDLTVTLKGPHPPYAWTVSATIVTDPGEQMVQAATDARLVLARRSSPT